MKYIATLTCLLLTSIIANPAFAVAGNDCAARSEKVKVTERDEFMKSCLAQVGTPANVKEAKQKHKSARCEQNAKNMKLQGADKGNYQADCINKNEAVIAANTPPKNSMDLGQSASADKQKSDRKKSASHKTAVKKHAKKKPREHKKNVNKSEKQSTPAAGANEAQ